MVRTSVVTVIVLIAFIVGFILGFAVARKYRPCINLPVVTIQRDTVTVRDTIKGEVPKPRQVEVVRIDTVRIEINGSNTQYTPADTTRQPDTIKASDTPRTGQSGELLIPITRKVYATNNYRAVVSGWRPALDSIEVYQDTRTITNTVTKYKAPRIALMACGGAGYTTDKKVIPFVGLAVGVVLWSK